MRRPLALAVCLALLLATFPAAAQLVGADTAPGDPCGAGIPQGATRMTADPDHDGGSVVLICDGTNWQAAMSGGGGGGSTATHAFMAHRNGSNFTLSGSDQLVNWTTESYDLANDMNLSTDRLTPTEAGYYYVAFTTSYEACSAASPYMMITKNGTIVAEAGIESTDLDFSQTASTIVYMNGATDYIETHVDAADCDHLEGNATQTYFTGFKVDGGGGGGGGASALDDLSDVIVDYSASNMFLGDGSGINISNPGGSTALGKNALNLLNNGDHNTAIGLNALSKNAGNSDSTAVGRNALMNSDAGYETAVGSGALSALTNGANNTALGYNAGSNLTTGAKNIMIGYGVAASAVGASNELNIGNVLYGTGIIDGATRRIGIGDSAPSSTLDVNGTATATLFSGSGASLTTLNASNLSSGTVNTARLGSGTASSSTFLRGDQTWAAPTVTETDPSVSAVTNGKWCRGTGTQVTCDQTAPNGISSVTTVSCAISGGIGVHSCTASCAAGYFRTGCSVSIGAGTASPSSTDSCSCSSSNTVGTCYAYCLQ